MNTYETCYDYQRLDYSVGYQPNHQTTSYAYYTSPSESQSYDYTNFATPARTQEDPRATQLAQIRRNEEIMRMLSPIRKCQERLQSTQTRRNAENARRKFSLTNRVRAKSQKASPQQSPKSADAKTGRTSLSMRRWKTEIIGRLRMSASCPAEGKTPAGGPATSLF